MLDQKSSTVPERWPLCRVPWPGSDEILLQVFGEDWPDRDPRSGTPRLAIVGELCFVTSPSALRSLEWLCDVAERLVLDLSEVTFIDSNGVGLLVEARNRLRAHGAELIIESPSARVVWILTVLNLSELLSQGHTTGLADSAEVRR